MDRENLETLLMEELTLEARQKGIILLKVHAVCILKKASMGEL